MSSCKLYDPGIPGLLPAPHPEPPFEKNDVCPPFFSSIIIMLWLVSDYKYFAAFVNQ